MITKQKSGAEKISPRTSKKLKHANNDIEEEIKIGVFSFTLYIFLFEE